MIRMAYYFILGSRWDKGRLSLLLVRCSAAEEGGRRLVTGHECSGREGIWRSEDRNNKRKLKAG